MYDLLYWIGNGYQFYRASQDAGIWLIQMNSHLWQHYMETSMRLRGLLP